MALINKVESLVEWIKYNKEFLDFNRNVFDIREGELFEKVVESIKKQISDVKTAEIMSERVPPINVLNKIISKTSTLYTDQVERVTENTSDNELISEYAVSGVNDDWNDSNENYNAYKNTTIEIYLDEVEKAVKTRSVPSYQFLPYSDDPVDSTRMTVMLKYIGRVDGETDKFYAYSDDEFISFTTKGEIVTEDMLENEGVNPYGVIPFTYINKSRNLLVPMPDRDILRMTVLIPLLLSEINFGNQYLSQPIITITDLELDDSTFSRNANTVLMLKSDADSDKQGSMNVLSPNMNITEQLKLVSEQLAFWLTTRDIRPGTFGISNGESVVSALALMIKEMDATNNRKSQASKFSKAEIDFWKRLARVHNTEVDAGRIESKTKFSDENLLVVVKYSDQASIETKLERATRLKLEREAGLNSRRNSIREYHPHLSEDQIDELMTEIKDDESSSVNVPAFVAEA